MTFNIITVMKEKILTALKTKFPGASAKVLDRIAEKLAKTVTTDEQVTTAVAGVTQEFIDIVESYGDSRATEAQQTAVQNYENKYGLKDGVKIDSAGGGTGGQQTVKTTQQEGGDQNQTAQMLQQILDQNKKLQDRLDRMEGERVTAGRRQQIMTEVEKLPASLRKAYERTPVDKLTEEEFAALLGEIKTEVSGIMTETQTRGAVFGRPAAGGGAGKGELTKEQEAAIAARPGKTAEGQPF